MGTKRSRSLTQAITPVIDFLPKIYSNLIDCLKDLNPSC